MIKEKGVPWNSKGQGDIEKEEGMKAALWQ